MKKKTSWKTPLSDKVSHNEIENIRLALCDLKEGRSALLGNQEKAEKTLTDYLIAITKLKEENVKIELLARFLNASNFLDVVSDEFFDALEEIYYTAAEYFVESAENYTDEEFLCSVVHDLVVRHSGYECLEYVFSNVSSFIDEKKSESLMLEILNTIESHDLETEEQALDALSFIADSFNNSKMFEKVMFLHYPERPNDILLQVANSYLSNKKISDAKRLILEIQNPTAEEEQDLLDIEIAIASAEGLHTEARRKAKKFYELYPTDMNIAKVVNLFSDKEKNDLFKEHIEYRMPELSDSFLFVLASHKKYDLIDFVLNKYGETSLTTLNADILKETVSLLKKEHQEELAHRIEKWIVEEPEDLTEV